MRTYNRIFLIGNCAATPTLADTKKNKPYLFFPIAVNRNNSSESNEVDFHRIILWGETATKLENLIQKGSRLFVTGKLINHKYENNGDTKYMTEIHASQIEILTFKDKNKETSALKSDKETEKELTTA